jgi:very-short-patch-repair endonuclease
VASINQTKRYARQMRMKPTRTESKLFEALTKALEKTTARVHLQHIIGWYIADLYIPYAQIIIEADGASHAGREQYDARRESYMKNRGYRTIRFSNIEIWQDCDGVVKHILDACGPLKAYDPKAVKITYCPPSRSFYKPKARRISQSEIYRLSN